MNMRIDKTGEFGKPTLLVTGATGFLGSRLTAQLSSQGYRVRALVRERSNTVQLKACGVDIAVGDVRDAASLELAMQGMAVVIHAAADTTGEAQAGWNTTVMGTRNVVNAALGAGVGQMIYLSTCNVYGISECQSGQEVNESGPLEQRPAARGHYTHAKLQAEQIVLEEMKNGLMNITCLRPGTIWGPGGETFTPMMGMKLGKRIVGIIGNNDFVLPLVYLDNLVSAIIKCINHPGAYNKIFNVVDPHRIDKKTYTRAVLKPLIPGAFFFRIPYWLLYVAVGCQEILFGALRRNPFLTRYRLISSQRPIVYDSGKIMRDLNWTAPVGFDDAVHHVLQYYSV